MDSSFNNAAGNFDFSRPPPGYPAAARAPPLPTQPYNQLGHYPMMMKSEANLPSNSPAASPNAARLGYYQGPDLGGSSSRPSSQNSYISLPPAPPEPPMPTVNSQMFSVPPPPPAMIESYAPMPGYMGSYGYSMPPPSPGAGQYVIKNPNQGNLRLQQYQREHGSGYAKRGTYNNHLNRKRNMSQEYDNDGAKKGSAKKKKKPLSQNMPTKKDWTLEDAKRALDVEREFNKRHKSQSLIIKFPDLELSREIVQQFHSKIESVHFQQPCTPRFCFVTLSDNANMEEVIKELRHIKFGPGYLMAEPKNNKEEDSVKGPEDIDPLTLYVGNLAQEITVDDVFKAYPKNKRIDIGYAKRIKYTRYAFVSFRTVDDAIEAFQSTHATEMYNKSLIVRFRRLHGTVGLPGDPKPQNTRKRAESELSDQASVFASEQKFSPGATRFRETEFYGLYEDEGKTTDNDTTVKIKTEPLDEEPVHAQKESPPLMHVPIIQVKTEPELAIPFQIKEEMPEQLEEDTQAQKSDFMSSLCNSDSDDDDEDYSTAISSGVSSGQVGFDDDDDDDDVDAIFLPR